MEESASLNEIEWNEQASHLLDEDEHTRYEAARAMARMGREVIERTLPWTEDSRPLMREMACFILGQVGHDLAEVTLELDHADDLGVLHEHRGAQQPGRLVDVRVRRVVAGQQVGDHVLGTRTYPERHGIALHHGSIR